MEPKCANRRSNKDQQIIFRKGWFQDASNMTAGKRQTDFWVDQGAERADSGSKSDAKTHKKSMPKQVSFLMKAIKQYIIWCVKPCKFMFNTMRFEGLAGRVRERKRYQQIIKHDTQTHPKVIRKTINKSIGTFLVKRSSKIGPCSAHWSKKCSGLIKDACGLPPNGLC